MRILTTNFALEIGRPVWERPYGRRQWDRWYIRIGFGECGEINRWYKYWAGVDIQLLPNFIWWQDVIRQDRRVADVQIHSRIAGIQNWPFMRFCGGRP